MSEQNEPKIERKKNVELTLSEINLLIGGLQQLIIDGKYHSGEEVNKEEVDALADKLEELERLK